MICKLKAMCTDTVFSINLSEGMILAIELTLIALYAGTIWYFIHKRDKKALRNMGITLIGVILFELMINPMVMNTNFHWWTYYWGDLNWVVAFGWVIIVAVAISLVDFAFPKSHGLTKFVLIVGTIDVITIPAEIFLVHSGLRVYSESLLASSYGVWIPYTSLPLEVMIAIPLFFALVVGFTKYWENVLDETA